MPTRCTGRWFIAGAVAAMIGWAGPVRAQGPTTAAPVPGPAVSAPATPQIQDALCGGLMPAADSDPAARFWGRAEYLLWWVKGQKVPPLVTTGPEDQVNFQNQALFIFPGVLGLPGTSVVMGGDTQTPGPLSGGRFTLGGWLDPSQRFGLEGSYMFLGRASRTQTVSSPGNPPLSIPFFDITLGRESTAALASPLALRAGRATLTTSTRLQGAEANAVLGLLDRGDLRLEGLVGFRWLNLDESLEFDTSTPNISNVPPTFFLTRDQFFTHNNFYGGQLGLRGEVTRGVFFLTATGKVALGSMIQSTRISGLLATNEFQVGFAETFPAGYFAAPTNSGEHRQSRFAVVPEVNLTAGVEVIDGVRLSVGYSFLYLSSVTRPAAQMDRVLNPTQLPAVNNIITQLEGAPRPAFPNAHSDFWTHGLNFGLELSY